MTSALPPRFAISEPEIARVVARFYDHVRRHPGLGPVFAVHVSDWPAHEDRVTRFWCNIILHAGGYDGNPVAVHRDAGNVRPGMFETWLALFDMVLHDELTPAQAAAWSALAARIGAPMRAAVTDRARDTAGAPLLRGRF